MQQTDNSNYQSSNHVHPDYSLTIYIKWLPKHYGSDFIHNKFANHGLVSSVRFIPKQSFSGELYNSAIVTFSQWFLSEKVHQLFTEMNNNIDGTAKFYYHDETGRTRYWHVKEYSPLFEDYDNAVEHIYSLANSKNKIEQMDDVIKSMAAQLHYFKTKNLQLETKMAQNEHNNTIIRLQNSHLNGLIDDRDRDMFYMKSKMQLLEMELANERQQSAKANQLIEELYVENRDQSRIIDYYQQQLDTNESKCEPEQKI